MKIQINKTIVYLLGICLFLMISVDLRAEFSAQDFLLKNYSEVAIATDLEPDDLLALAILFDQANRFYTQSKNCKYPIDLILVGEGNTAIKRMRMKKCYMTISTSQWK